MRVVKAVWTTNFDALATRAANNVRLTPIEVGTDTQHRIIRPAREGELLCVSMHGDYRYEIILGIQTWSFRSKNRSCVTN
jgi:hypothetical protein